jgi:hypothetical protein
MTKQQRKHKQYIDAIMGRDRKIVEAASQRRYRIPGCPTCELYRNEGPWHDASPRCESGHHNHCTCAKCF